MAREREGREKERKKKRFNHEEGRLFDCLNLSFLLSFFFSLLSSLSHFDSITLFFLGVDVSFCTLHSSAL